MNNNIPAVEKTIMMLELLAGLTGGATQAELKNELNISMSTAYRILQTLLKHKWVMKDSSGVYTLDNGLLPLVYPFKTRMSVLERAQHVIDDLAETYDIACKISIRRGLEQVTLMRAEAAGPFSLAGHVGSSFPLTEGSVGAALLSGCSDAEIREIAAECEGDIPENRNPELVLANVRNVRSGGYAINLRKNRWNIAAMSMPIYDEKGSVTAALTLIGAESDFTGGNLEKMTGVLRTAAGKCSVNNSSGKSQRTTRQEA
ncbi:MAG: IclR family transcriptional regulator [Victivallaceae bacterium]|nr:IclR family transcriptional regulator [Victivallaceae bacterium]